MAVSSLIRFGTSTWTYEGWQGQVYKRDYKKTTFARECLGEYCQYLYNGEPLFRTVGNDSILSAADRQPAGPFLFEFQRHGMLARDFVVKLDAFFGQLPQDFSYAVEIRNAGILGALYRDILVSHGVAHVYNHWSFMPSLADQHEKMVTFTAPFTVLRLLTPLKMSYEAAKKCAEPYTKIVGELPDMRKEAVVLIKDAIGHNRRAYVLVNNRLEGNAR